ncbi:alpha/beta fold hydrolase [Maritimibacter dapengensis]|uniref:Alpha/beta hydrolase n=1 Tax=Maritimibacter dapengensis TaxID=2836868 RepID=A0ABS6T635_9RHOB|nr:alpha/beta hydrolase [Maritimibacter dapengensis]
MSEGLPIERIAGFPTHVSRLGAGVRRALFIHCTQAHLGAWTAVQALLLDKLSMTSFDRPGHGESADWYGGDDAAALHTLTTSIAGALINKRADVIGHSFGATVALRLAMERPEQVRAVVLIEPVMFAAIRSGPHFERVNATMRNVKNALDGGDAIEAARIFNDAVTPEMPFDELPEGRQVRMATRARLVLTECGVTLDDAPGLLDAGRLEKVKQPVLLLEGSNAPPGIREINDVLSARLPNVQRVVVVGAGHMSPLTHPENIAGEIATFLKL